MQQGMHDYLCWTELIRGDGVGWDWERVSQAISPTEPDRLRAC
jgi:hypothetical protein